MQKEKPFHPLLSVDTEQNDKKSNFNIAFKFERNANEFQVDMALHG